MTDLPGRVWQRRLSRSFPMMLAAAGVLSAQTAQFTRSASGQRQATQLSSGVPINFALTPRSAPTLFNGPDGYTIVVPTGATELRIQLQTATAGVNVDLYASFEVDPNASGSVVVAEHKSESPGGAEQILITAASSPPLRAGTYFIALGLFTLNTAVTGTLTATVSGGGVTPPATTNLIVNGDAEAGPASPTCSGLTIIPGWTSDGNVSVCTYATGGGFPTQTSPGPPNRGNNFFSGGFAATSVLAQIVDVTSQSAQIDTGAQPFVLSAFMGGSGAENDNVTVSVTFLNAMGALVGSATLPAVLAADRGGVTGLISRNVSGLVPAGTRSVSVLAEFRRISGATNDAFLDNLSLIFGSTQGPPPDSGSLNVSVTQEDNSSCPAAKKLIVSVRDQFNQAVSGLTAANFTLTENAQARTITVNCSSAAGPLSVAIVIDASAGTAADLTSEKAAASLLVSQLAASDTAAVFSFGDAVVLRQGFTNDKILLNSAIDSITAVGGSALYRAISDAAQAIQSRAGRKAILVVTGSDNTVAGTTLDQAIQAAQAAGTPVFAVGFGPGINSIALGRISNETGAFFTSATTAGTLAQIFSSLGQVFSALCEISYTPVATAISATVAIGVSAGSPGSIRTGNTIKVVSACSTVPPPGSGCPSNVNIALNRTATQSSTAFGGPANLGNDGILQPDYGLHTDLEDRPYWQVDFGLVSTLCQVRLYNRVGVPDRARTINVLVSVDGVAFQTAYAHNGTVWGADGSPLIVDLQARQARYLRVQLTERNYLHLREVEVFGVLGAGGGTGNLSVFLNQEDNSSCPAFKKLLVMVRDLSGQAVAGLGAGSFSLLENGQPRPVTVNCALSATAATAASVAVVIDASGSPNATDLAVQKTAVKSLISQLGANDSIAVLSFSDTVTLRQNFTTERALVLAAVDAVQSGPVGGQTALYKGVQDAAQALLPRPGRKLILVTSDGPNTTPGIAIEQAIAAAQQARAPVFPIGFGNAINATVLTRLAAETGGFETISENVSNLLQLLPVVGQILASQCEISYAPAAASAAAAVTVNVTAAGNRGGSVVRSVGACLVPAPGADTTQPGCDYSVQPLALSFAAIGGSAGGAGQGTSSPAVTVSTRTDCRWGAISNDAFITIESGATGLGSGQVTYRVAQNTNTVARTGALTIAGVTHTVSQAAAARCVFQLASNSLIVTGGGGLGSVTLTASFSDCVWTALSNVPWISIAGGSGGRGNGRVDFAVAVNPDQAQRVGTLNIAGLVFTVTQQPRSVFGDPQVPDNGIVPTTSGIPTSLPGGALTQGAFFSVYGFDLGPDVPVTAGSFPLPTILGAVSVQIRQGGRVVNCIMHYASRRQINGIVPSNAPLGEADMVITYIGRSSRPIRVTIVQVNFGIFTSAGAQGPGIITNFISQTNQPLNSRSIPARPLQRIIIWGSGGGGISTGDDVAPPATPLPVDYEVLIGGRRARNAFIGRNGGFAALDVVHVDVPEDAPFGCAVPVQVRVQNSWSNAVTMAISPEGQPCTDPQNPFVNIAQRGGRAGGVFLVRSTGTLQLDTTTGPQPLQLDLGLGVFAAAQPQGTMVFSPLMSPPPVGTCTVSTGNQDLSGLFGGILRPPDLGNVGVPLDAGLLTVTNAGNQNADLPRQDPGSTTGPYFGVLGGAIPGLPAASQFLVTGQLLVRGAGGRDVGPFEAMTIMPAAPSWTNRELINLIERGRGVTVTWAGGDANQIMVIAGSSTDQRTKATASFFCLAPSAAGVFTVPPAVLYNLGTTASTPGLQDSFGLLMVGSTPANFATFAAAGLDVGVAIPVQLDVRTLPVR
jgi:uncharacterized protein (TIGR03437 family)